MRAESVCSVCLVWGAEVVLGDVASGVSVVLWTVPVVCACALSQWSGCAVCSGVKSLLSVHVSCADGSTRLSDRVSSRDCQPQWSALWVCRGGLCSVLCGLCGSGSRTGNGTGVRRGFLMMIWTVFLMSSESGRLESTTTQ